MHRFVVIDEEPHFTVAKKGTGMKTSIDVVFRKTPDGEPLVTIHDSPFSETGVEYPPQRLLEIAASLREIAEDALTREFAAGEPVVICSYTVGAEQKP